MPSRHRMTACRPGRPCTLYVVFPEACQVLTGVVPQLPGKLPGYSAEQVSPNLSSIARQGQMACIGTARAPGGCVWSTLVSREWSTMSVARTMPMMVRLTKRYCSFGSPWHRAVCETDAA